MKGFGCELLGYDVYHNPACVELGLRYTDLPTLLAQSDIISIHCPLTPETKHLINEQTIQREALTQITDITLGNISDFEAGSPKAENIITTRK